MKWFRIIVITGILLVSLAFISKLLFDTGIPGILLALLLAVFLVKEAKPVKSRYYGAKNSLHFMFAIFLIIAKAQMSSTPTLASLLSLAGFGFLISAVIPRKPHF